MQSPGYLPCIKLVDSMTFLPLWGRCPEGTEGALILGKVMTPIRLRTNPPPLGDVHRAEGVPWLDTISIFSEVFLEKL